MPKFKVEWEARITGTEIIEAKDIDEAYEFFPEDTYIGDLWDIEVTELKGESDE